MPDIRSYRIFVRDSGRNRVAEISEYYSLTMTLRFNRVGGWILKANADAAGLSLLTFGGGLVVTRNGTTILSGPLRRRVRVWDVKEDSLVASGPDDLIWITDRLALPVVTGPPYTASAYDVRTAVAETAIKQYVDFNAGPSANSQRRVSGLTIQATAGTGASVTGRARFVNLLELIQELALAGGGLGFRVVPSGTNLEFQVYTPADKTATVFFSETFGNLESFDYDDLAPEMNYVIVAGGGEGTARVFEEMGDSASIIKYGRIEMFRDRRDTSDAAELRQTGNEELDDKAQHIHLKTKVLDTDAIAFGTDYNLGDRVTVMVDGVAFAETVREVKITLTPDKGEEIEPVICTPSAGEMPLRVLADLRNYKSRLSLVERR